MKTKIAIKNYMTYLENNRYSKYTITSYKININRFLKVAPNKVEDISKDTIKKFIEQLKKEPVAYKTKNDRLISVRNFLKYVSREIEINYHWNNVELFSDRTDSGKIHVPKQKVINLFLKSVVGKLDREKTDRKRFLLPEKQLISENRSDAIVNTLYATGLRLSELVSLNRDDIFPLGLDLDSEEADKIETVEITIIGKGSKVRLVFINKETLEILKKYLKLRKDNSEALFVSVMNCPISRVQSRSVQTIISNRVELLEKQNIIPVGTLITPHTMRHAYATNLIASGASLIAVKDLLGHASINTTQRYLHLSNANLKNEYVKVYG